MNAPGLPGGIESMVVVVEPFARWMLRSSVQAALVVLLVLMLRRIASPLLSARWRHALWGLVLLRVILPLAPESRFSLMNLTSAGPPRVDGCRAPIFRVARSHAGRCGTGFQRFYHSIWSAPHGCAGSAIHASCARCAQ
jgi:hypothetical protein